LRGRLVWQSTKDVLATGSHVVSWPGADESGRRVPAGIYLYRVLLDEQPAGSGKLAVVK
jgi:hypothetical protein